MDRLAAIEIGTEPTRFTDLDAIEIAQNELAFTVRRSDLDLADHVNNTSYVDWAVEAVPDEVWGTHDLARLEIQYLSECHHGQTILSRGHLADHDNEIRVNHQLVREEDGAEVARALSRWRNRSG